MSLLCIIAMIMALSLLGKLAWASPVVSASEHGRVNFTSMSANFSWTDIKPTPELQYHDCGGNFQCARVELPLNWNATGPEDPTYNEKFNMAIVKLPAQVPVTDERYGGPVLINPGGPGGSGAAHAFLNGQLLQTQIDAAYSFNSSDYVSSNTSAKYFDIIGFDPRGVNNSTPYHVCFKDPAQLQNFDMLYGIPNLVLEWPNKNFDALWQSSAAMGAGCVWDPVTNPNGSKIASFSSTAMVARDMVEFVERHGEWREKQAIDADTKERLKWQKGEEPLLVHAVSYGTVLGATIAAMQPHRVNRIFLDGVSDTASYYQGNLTTDVLDGDKPIQLFFEYCAQAGKDKCPLWAGNSSHDTEARLQSVIRSIEEHGPVPVPGSGANEPDNIDMNWVKGSIIGLSYGSLNSWPEAAAAFAGLSQGNGTLAAISKQNQISSEPLSSSFDLNDPSTSFTSAANSYQGSMIQAGDQTLRYSQSDFLKKQWQELHDVVPWTGDEWATTFLNLYNWPIIFDWRFGDKHEVGSNVTANPVLFSSNIVDGVTGLPSAKLMHSRFKGSGLLITDGEGHTAAAEPSLCYAKAVRHYFQTGELPDTSKHCLPARRPFLGSDGPNTEKIDVDTLSLEDRILFGTVELTLTS